MKKSNHVFAILLLVFGVIFLADNFKVISISWEILWTVFPLWYGLSLFFQYYKTHNKELLTLATFMTTIGAFFLVTALPFGIHWTETTPWWPVFPLAWGLGIFVTFLADKKDSRMLLYSVIIFSVSIYFFVGNEDRTQSYLNYWPVLLILIGIGMLYKNKRKVEVDKNE